MTAPDPAVALDITWLVTRSERYIAHYEGMKNTSDNMLVARAVVAMDAELTALRARVGEVERETAERIAAWLGHGGDARARAICDGIRAGAWKEHP